MTTLGLEIPLFSAHLLPVVLSCPFRQDSGASQRHSPASLTWRAVFFIQLCYLSSTAYQGSWRNEMLKSEPGRLVQQTFTEHLSI